MTGHFFENERKTASFITPLVPFAERLIVNMKEINKQEMGHLPKKEQVKKLQLDSKIRLIIICIYVPLMIIFSIYLIVLKEPRDLGIAFLFSIPVSVYLGYILPVKQNKKRIEELTAKQ